MKKTIITTAICYILFEVIFYFSIAFTHLSLDPFLWSEHARSGFGFITVLFFLFAVIIGFALSDKE